MKPQVTAELTMACPSCGEVRPIAAVLAVGLAQEDSWAGLFELLARPCDACGQPRGVLATMLLDGEGADGRPRYLLVAGKGSPAAADADRGRAFLIDHGLPPAQVARLVPVGSPASADGLAAPRAVRTRGGHRDRGRGRTACPPGKGDCRAGAAGRGHHAGADPRAAPDLPGARDGRGPAEAELSERLNWPPEAAGLLAARGALISVLAGPVTGAGLEAAFDAFAAAREAAMTEIVQAGYQKIIWLGQHASAPDSEWDAAAAQALRLLGFGGDKQGSAMLLHRVGVAIAQADRHPGAGGLGCPLPA